MSKIIKTIGKIVGTVLMFVPGLQIVGAAILIATSIGASLLAKKPPAQKASPENYNRLRASIDPRTQRKTCVGITALATDIRDEEFTDSQAYVHRFIVCASHEVEAIDEIWFDDKQAWTVGGGVTSDFTGYLTVAAILVGSSANAINISSRMGTGRRYTGLAYVHLTYKLTGNSDDQESPFAQSITTRITIRGKGAFFYDPRLDSTVDGGSGSHRADDQSTWEWDADACRNPALALLFYLLGWRITNPSTSDELLAVGKGIPQARIDLESFAVAANICDESVSKVGGGTEPRYRCDGVWSEGDDPTTVIDMLKSTMNADLDDVDGKLRLTIFKNDLASPIADFDEDDILDEFQWTPCLKLEDTPNVIMGHYIDPSDDALYQPVDYPQISYDSSDGIDRIETFQLPMVQSVSQAQRLASLRLLRQSFGGTFVAAFQATAWAVQKNDIIRLTFAPTGFASKYFRVAEMELREDGTVPLVLREEHADIYETPSLIAALTIAATTPYDPSLNAIVSKLNTVTTVVNGTRGLNNLLVDDTFDPKFWVYAAQASMIDYTPAMTGKALQIGFEATTFAYTQYVGAYGEFTPVRPNKTVFFSLSVDSTPGTDADWFLSVRVLWFDENDDVVSAEELAAFTPDGGGEQSFVASRTPPATVIKCSLGIGHASYASQVGQWTVYDPYVSHQEPGADISAGIDDPGDTVIECLSTGVAKAGQVNPRYIQFVLRKNDTDITNLASWSRVVDSGTITCAMGNTASTDKGRLNITGPTDNTITSGQVTVTAVFESMTYKKINKITKISDPLPGGDANDSGSISGSTTSTTMVAVGDELEVVVAAGGIVDLTANWAFTPASSGPDYCYGQWREWNGSAFVTLGSESVSSAPAGYSTYYDPVGNPYYVHYNGGGTITYHRTGLTPGAAGRFKFYARSSATLTHSHFGTCSAAST